MGTLLKLNIKGDRRDTDIAYTNNKVQYCTKESTKSESEIEESSVRVFLTNKCRTSRWKPVSESAKVGDSSKGLQHQLIL